MKCIIDRDTDISVRVPDRQAKICVESGAWRYTSKGRWKRDGRIREDKTYHKAELKAIDGWT